MYDIDGSGAYSTDVPYALEQYFNYNNAATYQSRGLLSSWITMATC